MFMLGLILGADLASVESRGTKRQRTCTFKLHTTIITLPFHRTIPFAQQSSRILPSLAILLLRPIVIIPPFLPISKFFLADRHLVDRRRFQHLKLRQPKPLLRKEQERELIIWSTRNT
jgi:hypothetical protein